MVYSLTWLPEVLEAAGLKVSEHPGWRTRGSGDVGTTRGVMVHHTAGSARGVMPSLNTIVNGRAASGKTRAMPGPLAQLALARDGTFFVIAAGRANHAGAGNWEGIAAGNTSFIGIEAENTGTGEIWPEVQLDALRRGIAAILKHIGAPETMCCGHKEFALPKGRKIDPDFEMEPLRAGIRAIMNGEGQIRPAIPAADASGRPTLRRGSKGDLVKQIQHALGLSEDGSFGAQTEAAIRALQRSRGLVPDGIVGPRSWIEIVKHGDDVARIATQPVPEAKVVGALLPGTACLELVKHYESCKLDAYPDPGTNGDPWTIGWGSTGNGIAKGVRWTRVQCDERFGHDIADFGSKVAHLVDGAKTSQHQFDALTSFAYNAGIKALGDSTLLRKHRAGDSDGAANEFGRWVHAGGRVMQGLVTRRQAEAELYRRP